MIPFNDENQKGDEGVMQISSGSSTRAKAKQIQGMVENLVITQLDDCNQGKEYMMIICEAIAGSPTHC